MRSSMRGDLETVKINIEMIRNTHDGDRKALNGNKTNYSILK